MSVPTVKLNDGTSIPKIGFGVGTALYKSDCAAPLTSALKTGYDYIDTAQQYGNTNFVGQAIKEANWPRDKLYVLAKCGNKEGEDDPREVLKGLLNDLQMDYVDMYLMHNPFFAKPLSLSDNWKIMESLKKEGLTKSIGVSNYREEDILEMKDNWEIPPALNQIEFSPYVYHAPNVQRLLKLCDSEGITIFGYGQLNSLFRSTDGPVDPVVKEIAKAKNVTESQVLIAWAAQQSKGGVVTTSRDPGRQKEQLEAITKMEPLTDEQMKQISEAGRGRTFRHFQGKVWDAALP